MMTGTLAAMHFRLARAAFPCGFAEEEGRRWRLLRDRLFALLRDRLRVLLFARDLFFFLLAVFLRVAPPNSERSSLALIIRNGFFSFLASHAKK